MNRYSQSHLPLIDQETIEGHSVRALYLTTAAADFGEEFLGVAKRLWDDAVDKKMYATGGLGSRPRVRLLLFPPLFSSCTSQLSLMLTLRPKDSIQPPTTSPNQLPKEDVTPKHALLSHV
jgi:hypothetical protein